MARMRMGFVVYDGVTALDFVGMYDPLTRLGTMDLLDDVAWDVCGREDRIEATGGLRFEVDVVDGSLDEYDVVLVPGGRGNRPLLDDPAFVSWLASSSAAPLVASVCTGALLLGEAGLLEGRRATTHPGSYDALASYCTVVRDRIVDDGDVVTGGGVAAAVDLGLHLVQRLAGVEARRRVAAQMDYPYGPSVTRPVD